VIAEQYLIPGASFGAVAAATYAFLSLCDPYWRRVNNRIVDLQRPEGRLDEPETVDHSLVRGQSKLVRLLQDLTPNSQASSPRLQKRLTKAGLYRSDAESLYYTARLLLILTGSTTLFAIGYIGYVRMDVTILLTCVMAALGAVAPSLWLENAIHRRHLLLRKSLPDFLDLMTICLEGGLSLQETIKRVSEELRLAHPVLAAELNMVQRDVELGATVDQALKRFALRTDYEGVRTLSTFIREAQRFGTNITDALRSHADMLRGQREQAAEECAQKAAVKILIPTFLLIFPAIFIVAVGPAILQIYEAFSGK
jgi:tight adherence protein C